MPGLPPAELERPAEEYAVSSHARRILERSRREARERGEEAIGTEHLLLALLSDSRNGAVQTLEGLRTTSERIRRQLDRAREARAATASTSPASADLHLTSRSRPVSTS